MASWSLDDLVEGTDYELLDKVPEDCYCPICFKLLNNTMQMKCGHVLCAKCLQEHAEVSKERNLQCFCPVDREILDLKMVMPVLFVDRMVSSFHVRCLRNCEWTGQLSSLIEHRRKCPTKKCLFDGCDELVLPQNMKHHKKNCKFALVNCPYIKHGCNTKLRRFEKDKHMEENLQSHLELLQQALKESQKKYYQCLEQLKAAELKAENFMKKYAAEQCERNKGISYYEKLLVHKNIMIDKLQEDVEDREHELDIFKAIYKPVYKECNCVLKDNIMNYNVEGLYSKICKHFGWVKRQTFYDFENDFVVEAPVPLPILELIYSWMKKLDPKDLLLFFGFTLLLALPTYFLAFFFFYCFYDVA